MTRPLVKLSMRGGTLELWAKSAYEVQSVCGDDTIGFAFETQSGVDAIGAGKKQAFRRQANTLSWIPRGCPVFSCSEEGGEYLVIQGVSAAMVAHPDAARRPLNAIVDAEAVHAAYLLRRLAVTEMMASAVKASGVGKCSEVQNKTSGSAGQNDEGGDRRQAFVSALDILSATLLHHFDSKRPVTPWITGARLAVIDRFIDQHMHESLTIG
ncbi:MAG: hypothetical protein ACRYHA_11215 [Janthinobacterium lividum]